jgi:hypothetical protein
MFINNGSVTQNALKEPNVFSFNLICAAKTKTGRFMLENIEEPQSNRGHKSASLKR